MKKLDILAFGAHPDDVELGCSGTLLAHVAKGKAAGIVDLTRGELGTRGNAVLRLEEAAAAAKILKLSARENLGFADGFFANDANNRLAIIRGIRKYQPEIVLAPAIRDRHPDHGKAAQLIANACFLAGLSKIETLENNQHQAAWRPKAVYHYIQDYQLQPDFVVDISDFMEQKMAAVKAYGSQFYKPKDDGNEPQTYISSKAFMDRLYSRASEFGRPCGFEYGEGFSVNRWIGVKDLFGLE